MKRIKVFVEDEEAKLLFLKVKETLNNMKNAERISTTENFNSKLLSKIKNETPLVPNYKSNIFKLSPSYALIFSGLCLAVGIISYSLVFPKFGSNSSVEYSQVPIDKSPKLVRSQIVKTVLISQIMII